MICSKRVMAPSNLSNAPFNAITNASIHILMPNDTAAYAMLKWNEGDRREG